VNLSEALVRSSDSESGPAVLDVAVSELMNPIQSNRGLLSEPLTAALRRTRVREIMRIQVSLW